MSPLFQAVYAVSHNVIERLAWILAGFFFSTPKILDTKFLNMQIEDAQFLH